MKEGRIEMKIERLSMKLDEKRVKSAIELSKELCSILEHKSPLKTMRRAFWDYFSCEVESNHQESTDSFFLIEYLQSLFISISLKENLNPPTDEEWIKIKKISKKNKRKLFFASYFWVCKQKRKYKN